MGLETFLRANAIIIATVLVLALLIIISTDLFSPALSNPRITFAEAPLQKNSQFQLMPGERYVYSYMFNNSSADVTYGLYPGEGCTIIALLENLNATPACVGKDGTDPGGYNSTLANPQLILFKPWMLALKDGWRWNNTMYLSYDGGQQRISDTYYRVVRNDTYMNRTSFIVEIRSSSGPVDYEWVDAEKRVLLRETGDGYEIRLTQGLPMNGS